MKKIVSIIIFACVIVIFGYNEFGNHVFIFVGIMFVPLLVVWVLKKNPFFFKNILEILILFFGSILKKLIKLKLIKKIALLAAKHERKRKDKKRKKWKEIYKQEQQHENEKS